MRYRDYYEAIGALKEKLSLLRKSFYEYDREMSEEDFINMKAKIEKMKNQIEFYENMRRENERFNQDDSKHTK